MTNFANAVKNRNNYTLTENQAVAYKSTGNALLDLFSMAGAIRQKDYAEVSSMFQAAFGEDKLLATKLMFYARNVRGGLGERETFRKMLRSLATTNPEIVIKNMELIPFFGRYDDLYTLVGTKAENHMWASLAWTIKQDMMNMKAGKPVTLCAKWLKSINTSSKESIALGKLTAKQFGMTEKQYRKALSQLRAYIHVIERTMSAQDWEDIAYAQVPSHAMKNYRKAFSKHDGERFGQYIESVTKGEAKINSGALYPYDILVAGHLSYRGTFHFDTDPVLEEQWKALPNYIKKSINALVMCDTSASMEGLPMAIGLSLAVYLAERNTGAYKDLFMTFSGSPEFVELKGKTLREKLSHIKSIVSNTDLEAGMDLILKVAVENHISQDEMPKYLYVVSDMQFDAADENSGRDGRGGGWGYERTSVKKTFHQSMQTKFARAGYEMPTIVYWQVSQRQTAIQAKANDQGIILVSGASASTFRDLMNTMGTTPYEAMLDILNSEQYAVVQI
jgi:hypothetical protein